MRDEELLIQRLLSSEIKGYLLALFHKNPGLIDTADGIARRIGFSEKSVKEDILDLAEIGILSKKKVGNLDVFFLNKKKDEEVQLMIENYIRGLKKE